MQSGLPQTGLSPLLRLIQAKIEMENGVSDTPFIDGLRNSLNTLSPEISPELMGSIVGMLSETACQSRLLKRSLQRA